MKTLGIARKIDELGRIVLPVEMRRVLGIREGDRLGISVDGGQIVLEKLEETCTFCRGSVDLRPFRGKLVCRPCTEELAPGSRSP